MRFLQRFSHPSRADIFSGNPSCILIDEFSTGIDAKMKRDMWSTLRNVAVGKAIIITTRKGLSKLPVELVSKGFLLDSMEEASALATKVGILAKKMLGMLLFIDLAA